MSTLARAIAVVAAVTLTAGAAAAQDQPAEFQSWQLPGLTVTPGVTIGTLWDSNVAIQAVPAGQRPASSSLLAVEPFGLVEYRSTRTTFSAGYNGFARHYFTLSSLDQFEHRASLSFRRMVTRRVTVFALDDFIKSPTTDFVELNGFPFAREGARDNTGAFGVQARLSRVTDLLVRLDSAWVAFDRGAGVDPLLPLRGGTETGVHLELTRRLSDRLSAGGEYSTSIGKVYQTARTLFFQDAGGVIELLVGPQTTISAAAGLSSVRDRTLGTTQSGPFVRAGIRHRAERVEMSAQYQRKYRPSLAFGGTNRSQELNGYVRMPLSRNRLYVESSGAWVRTDPFTEQELRLNSIWLRGQVGYEIARWFRIEGYYQRAWQSTPLTAAPIARQLVGAQLVVAQPMRIR